MPQSRVGPCSVEGCDSAIHARRLCASHYVSWRSTSLAESSEDECNEALCARIQYAKGMCALHYERQRKAANPGLVQLKTEQGKLSHRARMLDPDYAEAWRQRLSQRGYFRYWSRQQVALVLERDGTDCHLCGEEIDLTAPRHPLAGEGWEMGLHLDHVEPLSVGGDDVIENVRPAHAWCNMSKGNGKRQTARPPFIEHALGEPA